MAYAEDLVKLRKRILDAMSFDLVNSDSKELYEATLIQIMNEAERQRQACVARAEELRRQAGVADGQANAFTQMGSIIYNVLNGYVMAAERQKREEAERAAEMAEKEALAKAALEAQAVQETQSATDQSEAESTSEEDSKKKRRK